MPPGVSSGTLLVTECRLAGVPNACQSSLMSVETVSGRQSRGRLPLIVATVVLALLPAVRMVLYILDGTHLQYADYWWMIAKILQPDGGLHVAGLFEFNNEHPVVLGQLLYWVNARLADGSNLTLGVVVVIVVSASVVLVGLIARSTFRHRPVSVSVLVVVSSALLFAPSGSWNFYRAMSGTAWLTANLFVVLALWAQDCQKRWLAVTAAVVASTSYGTGIVVWPALAVAGMVRNRRWLPAPELVVGFVLTAVWYAVASDAESSGLKVSWVETAHTLFRLVGGIFVVDSELLGAVALGSGVALSVWAVRRHPQAAAWVGIFAFGALATALIAAGRGGIIAVFGEQGRYTSLAALVWIGWLGLFLAWAECWAQAHEGRSWSRPVEIAAVSVAVVLLVVGATLEERDEIAVSVADQGRVDVALRHDFVEGTKALGLGDPFPPITETLRSVGHYPFNGSEYLDCGLAGRSVSDVEFDVDGPTAGSFSSMGPSRLLGGAETFAVVVPGEIGDPSCILVLDGDLVVGAAFSPSSDDPEVGLTTYQALAPSGAESYVALMVFPDGTARVTPPAG